MKIEKAADLLLKNVRVIDPHVFQKKQRIFF